ncbi:MAG: Abi family protein [Azonexus sp.]|jgi:abortive infection bacteriophage resistance protein|nr:Abi family protein [Azonexus sp.]
MPYLKPWISYADQVNLLIARGMKIEDSALALDYLERIGYYRLSGYWYAFRQRSGPPIRLDEYGRKPKGLKAGTTLSETFRPGASFQNAVDLYVFDKKLRLLVMDALERVEIALRVDISHTLGKLDPFAYLNPALFHVDFASKLDRNSGLSRHHAWLGKHAQLIGRSKDEFVKHNKGKYGLPLAIWVACEVWDFGTMSMLFGGMRETEQDAIASLYGVSNGRVFATWLRSLNYLRNVCAHHGRLWNRNIVEQPRLPPAAEISWVAPFAANDHARARCFLLLRMSCHLLRIINPNSTWPERMKALLSDFPDLEHIGLSLSGIGALPNWRADW